ncbi:DUF4397 domain-containing protein [Mucilaginibacter sp. Bleaf8]|uniref:DUF4397 domain-containing protein n=1 Tax=Mucilaginibacter sp. Bleaf8 TaxID=2834430 RepID=UPI001BCDE317|nr:DUF4397 domain-containing protein [Mucilaginibacter sp. Bleaf8]MBS7566405.1 DUF4397 domain-containing protein [Mucilaginibacter sp. Bleaf8]
MNRISSIYYLLIVFIAVGIISSCKKGDDSVPRVSTGPLLNVVNTTSETIDFYVNGVRQNTAGILPAGSTGYLTVPFGNQQFAFKEGFDRVNLSNTDTLFTLPLKLDSLPNIRYSVFASTNNRSGAIVTVDTLITDTTRNISRIRFVHAAANVPALRITMNDTLVFDNATYKSVSTFKRVTARLKTIKVYNGSATSPLATLTATLAAQRLYTLFVKGSLNGTGDAAFEAKLITNQ